MQTASTAPALYSRTVNGHLVEIVETGRPSIRYQVYSQPVGEARRPQSNNSGHKTLDAANQELERRLGWFRSQAPAAPAQEEAPAISAGSQVRHPHLGQVRVYRLAKDGRHAYVRRPGRTSTTMVPVASLTPA